MSIPEARFEIKKVTESEWLLLDHRYAAHDARQTVACIYRLDDVEVEVRWLRDLPLASFYMSVEDVLQDVQYFYTPSRATRPISIPHMPPLTAMG